MTGRTAATVYRDKSGKRVDPNAAAAQAGAVSKTKEEDEYKNMVWGKGLVQLEAKVVCFFAPLRTSLPRPSGACVRACACL